MYQLVRARHRTKRQSGRWVEADLSQAVVATLTTLYGDVMLYITYPGLQGVKALRFDNTANLRQGINATVTVQQWLTDLGNTTLPWEETLPNETVRLVEYAQAWHVGCDIQPRGRYGSQDTQQSVHEQEDLLLTHPKFSNEYIDKHCLFTVNGFIHLSDWASDGVRIINGNTTVRKCNDNQVGILSFENIGPIRKLPFTKEMISKQSEESTYYQASYVTVPQDIDLEGKTVLLVLGGYLQVLGDTYFQSGERTWRIELGNILFLERYMESVQSMDMGPLGLIDDPDNRTLFSVAELKGNDAMLNYLLLEQSFFVIVDTPHMFHEFEPIESLKLPGRYVNRNGKQLPLVGAYGRGLEYHTIEEHGFWVYCGSRNYRTNYVANTTDWSAQRLVDGGRYPALPKKMADAYVRILGTES